MATDLRTQFFNYMTLQRFADHTQRTYVTGVKGLADYYNQSPDTLTNEQIQGYLLRSAGPHLDPHHQRGPRLQPSLLRHLV